MVKTKEFKFNEAREGGSDKTCKPKKNFQLKRSIGGSTNTTAYVQILGIGMDTHDTTPSVLLFFDKQRFIFNAGEWTVRFCTEHKIKLSKIDHICFSRVCSETVGGFPGLLLTLAGMGDGVSPNGVEESAVNPSDVVVVYVCELHEIKGKFHKEKADALGVKVKTKFKKLTEGKSVKSDCLDITVHPSDVIGPPVPGPIVIIIDCPTDSHAQELLCTQSLNEYYSDSSNQPQATKIVNCFIHLGPASVVNSIAYNKWMKKFGSAQHVMAGHVMKQAENPILKSSARMAAQLNYLCPELFPPLSSWPTQDHSIAAPGLISSTEDPVSECESISAENLLKFTLRSHTHLGLDRSNVPSTLVASEVIDELLLKSLDMMLPKIYGMEGSNNAVKNLACLWISHIHADHHVGLARILALRHDLLKGVPHEPLIVIGPSQLEHFLDADTEGIGFKNEEEIREAERGKEEEKQGGKRE
ncbi:zinc phosphodiesterase ELAC protein 2-like protein [Corchorus olitorius]|uniref:ribonuclease Z n=1 Tax=Corchorus olitorius TaxID=93759 RepID=A0A1R3IKL9_9ROSI|nr:zinc phosphodiesterase ELAC protein 2-like protein [Corchorus olitorius]